MALIPPFYFHAVVAIGTPNTTSSSPVSWSATGFVYARLVTDRPADQEPHYRLFVISNRHVFEKKPKIILRFDNSQGGVNEFPVDLIENGKNIWTAHSDSTVDVAVLPIDINFLKQHTGSAYAFRSDKDILPFSNPDSKKLSEGDGVFVLGFPLGIVHAKKNMAIVRGGVIARINDCFSGSNTFLIDAQIFPGNSGGPVVLKPESNSIMGTESISKCLLLGIVSGYLPYQEEAISLQTGKSKVVFEENSGLGLVFTMDKIIEVVELSVAQGLINIEPAAIKT